jgi:hypothetical protein
MCKTRQQLYDALMKRKDELKGYKITNGKWYVTIVKKCAATAQLDVREETRWNPRANKHDHVGWKMHCNFQKRSPNGAYRYDFNASHEFTHLDDLIRTVKKFLKAAPIVKVAKKAQKTRHAKNKLKVLKTFEATQAILFQKNEVVDAKVYIYGDSKSIHDPEVDDLTIKADLWIASDNMTYRQFRWQSGHIAMIPRVVIETKNGKVIKTYRVPVKTQKEEPVITSNPEFIEKAIQEALFGK